MKIQSLFIFAFAAFLPLTAQGEQQHITVVTESTPITSVSTQQPKGAEATEFVRALLEKAGFSYDIQFVPWRRGYQQVKQSANTMIFPLARTAHRETDFQWVGQLIPIRYYLFRLKDRPELSITNLDEARLYRIGVVNYHAHHEYLLQRDFKQLPAVNSSEQNIKKLLLRRIDFFAVSDGGILPLCQRTQIDCSQITPALPLTDLASGLYMAFGQETDSAVVQRLRKAYQQLIEDGTRQKIFATRLEQLNRFHKQW